MIRFLVSVFIHTGHGVNKLYESGVATVFIFLDFTENVNSVGKQSDACDLATGVRREWCDGWDDASMHGGLRLNTIRPNDADGQEPRGTRCQACNRSEDGKTEGGES